jgi:hypothetical protein
MSFEEFNLRMDRLTERHEALAQSVELLHAEQRETGRQLAALLATVTGLAEIARSHEERLEDLEGGR